MKKRYLLLLLLICNQGFSQELSEYFAKDKDVEVKEKTMNYFASLSNVVDKELTKEDKSATIENIRQGFMDDDVVVKNDIPGLATEEFKINDYLQNLANTYTSEYVDITANIISISPIYYDNISRVYQMRVVVQKTTIIKKKEDDEKGKKIEGMFDFYFLFGKGKPARIASIQKNNPTALDGKTPVKLLTKEDLDKALVLGKPHFVFNIYPVGAQVIVNSASVVYSNGQKIEAKSGVAKIEIIAPNFQTQSFEIAIGDTGIYQIKRELSPKLGTLTMNVAEDRFIGARVHMKKGKETIGSLPIREIPLPYGIHKLIVNEQCFIQKKYIVNITDVNPNAIISVSLTPITKATNVLVGVGNIFGVGNVVKALNPCDNVK